MVYTIGLQYEDLNKFKIINNKKYLEYCNEKVEKFASLLICGNFSDMELPLSCLKKYYVKNFQIASPDASTNYFITESLNYDQDKIQEITESLCLMNSFSRVYLVFPITTEYAYRILDKWY